jgi:hypothetical protein
METSLSRHTKAATDMLPRVFYRWQVARQEKSGRKAIWWATTRKSVSVGAAVGQSVTVSVAAAVGIDPSVGSGMYVGVGMSVARGAPATPVEDVSAATGMASCSCPETRRRKARRSPAVVWNAVYNTFRSEMCQLSANLCASVRKSARLCDHARH